MEINKLKKKLIELDGFQNVPENEKIITIHENDYIIITYLSSILIYMEKKEVFKKSSDEKIFKKISEQIHKTRKVLEKFELNINDYCEEKYKKKIKEVQ